MDDNKTNQMIMQWINGDTSIENKLFNDLYPTLRKIVQREHRKINIHEMNTTLLVNEVYLKFKNNKNLVINDKNHLLALSARIIRFILIDSIQKNLPIKSGSQYKKVTLLDGEGGPPSEEVNIDFLNLHHLLNELETIDIDATRIIELRFFAGLSIDETAEVMNTNSTYISRNWKFAKTWLLNKMNETD